MLIYKMFYAHEWLTFGLNADKLEIFFLLKFLFLLFCKLSISLNQHLQTINLFCSAFDPRKGLRLHIFATSPLMHRLVQERIKENNLTSMLLQDKLPICLSELSAQEQTLSSQTSFSLCLSGSTCLLFKQVKTS